MNLLSAFPAVFEVLAEKELENKEMYTFREIPDTIIVSKASWNDGCTKYAVIRAQSMHLYIKGVLHPYLKISMFCVLSQNYQHFFFF